MTQLKPAEGVKFVEYDQYGLPKNDGFDYSKFISTDDARPDDAVLDVDPEELAANLAGHHLDIDKDPSKMTAEEKEVYDCLQHSVDEGEEAEYEGFEDDFIA